MARERLSCNSSPSPQTPLPSRERGFNGGTDLSGGFPLPLRERDRERGRELQESRSGGFPLPLRERDRERGRELQESLSGGSLSPCEAVAKGARTPCFPSPRGRGLRGGGMAFATASLWERGQSVLRALRLRGARRRGFRSGGRLRRYAPAGHVHPRAWSESGRSHPG